MCLGNSQPCLRISLPIRTLQARPGNAINLAYRVANPPLYGMDRILNIQKPFSILALSSYRGAVLEDSGEVPSDRGRGQGRPHQ